MIASKYGKSLKKNTGSRDAKKEFKDADNMQYSALLHPYFTVKSLCSIFIEQLFIDLIVYCGTVFVHHFISVQLFSISFCFIWFLLRWNPTCEIDHH